MGNLRKTRTSGNASKAEETRKVEQVPETKEITLKALKDAIPADCFESSVIKSFAYLFRDIVYAGVLVYAALHIDLIPNPTVRYLCWALYGIVQGFVFTGLWIIGHECGHGGFSKYQLLNHVVGWAVHSTLMVPFFSWQITHARHHRYTGNMEKDTVFVPAMAHDMERKKNSKWAGFLEMVEDTPAYTMIQLIAHQLLGWQTYLLFNISAGNKSLPENGGKGSLFKNASHFDPYSDLFTPSQRKLIAISDIGLLIMGSILYACSSSLGGARGVFLIYVVPYLWVHHWLIAITYLHHTHPSVPHLTNEKWNYTDGALCTVDRTIGFVGRHFFHEIIDYHVVHHLFPRIPFYEAERATKAIMPLLGDRYYDAKDEWFLVSLYTTFRNCKFVTEIENSGVLHWAAPKP